jgi:hypothetical protein
MAHDVKTYLEIHKTLSDELRHTANVVWQFSIAIIGIQGGAIAFSKDHGFRTPMGATVLITAFVLSFCFCLMLHRQATERTGFRDRIHAVEAELRKNYPSFFAPIPTSVGWFKSTLLAYILGLEAIIGLLLFILFLARGDIQKCKSRTRRRYEALVGQEEV